MVYKETTLLPILSILFCLVQQWNIAEADSCILLKQNNWHQAYFIFHLSVFCFFFSPTVNLTTDN